jgi:hypothetical protein
MSSREFSNSWEFDKCQTTTPGNSFDPRAEILKEIQEVKTIIGDFPCSAPINGISMKTFGKLLTSND